MRAKTHDRLPRPAGRVALAACLASLAFIGVGCGEDRESSTARQTLSDPGPVHVHGLGVNPDDGTLFIATHTGLFRAREGEQQSERVADRYQDTMGFTVVGPNRFLGSGHPDAREGLPPLLGLIESSDAGKTWTPISLLGEADFHVLESSGRQVYGFDSSGGRLMVSADRGRRWSERSPPEPLLSLAIDPADAQRVIASGESELHLSSDGGRHWRSLGGEPGFLAWPAAGRVYLVRGDGGVLSTRRPGRRWESVGEAGGQPAAFEAQAARELYVALHDGTVKRSGDGGVSWSVRAKP
jgi:hypothetical protein